MAVKEQKRLEEERRKRMTNGQQNDETKDLGDGIKGFLHRPSTVIHALRKGLGKKISIKGIYLRIFFILIYFNNKEKNKRVCFLVEK